MNPSLKGLYFLQNLMVNYLGSRWELLDKNIKRQKHEHFIYNALTDLNIAASYNV